jgi:molybdenum cofactor cytidylyltransferase
LLHRIMQPSPIIIVLAAGRGSRFNGTGHKLEQALSRNSVLGTTLASVRESCLPMVVVTTEAVEAEVARHASSRDIVVLPAVQAQQGMARSIAAGVSARPQAPGWLILPGDMPLIQPDTFHRVAEALPGHACVVPFYRGRRGHPVGFSSELFSELIALSGDEGARRLLLRYPAREVHVEDPGILVDIDTQADLDRAREQASG